MSKARKSAPERRWLMKSEPDAFSIDDLARVRRSRWDGVRNYQARNFMMNEMQVGDLALFYHSNAEPSAVVGVCRVSQPAAPDASARDPKSDYYDPKASVENPIWQCVEVEFVSKLPRAVSLEEIKSEASLASMLLVQRGQRLSIQPVTTKEFAMILAMAERPAPAAPPRKKAK